MLAQAAWVCLHEAQLIGDTNLDVNRTLSKADEIWAVEFPDTPRPAFSRGAIVANFQTVEHLHAAALRLAFGTDDASVPKLFHDLGRDLDYAAQAASLSDRRRLAAEALRDYVIQDLIRVSTDTASLRLYLDMLSRAHESILVDVAQEIYDSFQSQMTVALARVSRISNLRFDVEECARLLTALVEGAAMRITFDQQVAHSFATQVGIAASRLPAQMAQ